jgi:hypothetical protein
VGLICIDCNLTFYLSIDKVLCSPFCLSSDEGESYHRSDYNLDCNSDAYKAYAVVAIAFIFIYPVGVPTCFGALLFWNRHVLGGSLSSGQDADKWWYGDDETLHFLVDGYRVDTFWFEEVEFLRKILMAGARLPYSGPIVSFLMRNVSR